jgi:homoserine dehydrogenase
VLTTDAEALVERPDVDVVVEVIGGIEPARTLLLSAMKTGKSVVTANKALLAEDGATLHAAARDSGVDLYYEASVAGAIPLLRPLRESLAGDRITRVLGIVNGTTNFVLSRWTRPAPGSRRRWPRRPRSATRRPTRPRTSTGSTPRPRRRSWPGWRSTPGSAAADVHREGIAGVTSADVASAKAMGCTVKLLAIC